MKRLMVRATQEFEMRRLLMSMGLALLLVALATDGFSQQPVPPQPPQAVISGSSIQIFTVDEKGSPTPRGAQPSFRITTSPNDGGNGNPNGRGNGNGRGFGGAAGSMSTILGGMMMQGMGGQGGGGSRMGGMGGDPNQMFNMFSKGKEVINRSDLPAPFQPMFDRIAPQMGITNGQITRQQFLQASEQMRSRMQQMGGGGGGPGSMTPEQFDRFAEGRFRRSDQNNDGLLSANEMPENLRSVWEKFDLNKDGAIDLNEFKGFMRSQFQQNQSPKPVDPQQPVQMQLPIPDTGSASNEDDRRPTVYRAGKLPKDIPAWFDQLDTDRDGQIGLYEWVNGNRSVDEFRQIDRNEDGFITIDEVMIYVRGNVANGSQGDMYASNIQNGFNGFGNGMMMQFGDNGNQDNRGRPGRGRGGENGGGRGPGGGPMMRGGDNGGGRGPGGRGRGGDFNGGGNNGNGFFGNGFFGGNGGGNNGNGFNGGGPGRGGDNSGFQGRGRGGDKGGGGPGRGRGGDNGYGQPQSDNGKTVPPRNNRSYQGYGGE
jgi:Ca2+-binding EF-hand superfamily protein